MRDGWWVVVGYAIASIVTFAAYGFDKGRAVRRGRRVSERRLHGLELLGGWPGGILGRMVFSHKRRKLRYTIVSLCIIGLHIVMWIAWCKWKGPC